MLVATYGTLRLNQSNYNRLLGPKTKHLGTFNTEPIYKMFHLGGFPGVLKNGETSIVCDVFDVTASQWEQLCWLEGYNGNPKTSFYYPEKIPTPYGEAEMFFFGRDIDNDKLITSGDWLNIKFN